MSELPLEYASIPPEGVDGGPSQGLFILHGRGADERDLLPIAQRLPGRYHVISLQAPTEMGPGYTWYGLDLSDGGLHSSQPDVDDFRRSLDLVAESIEAAVSTFGLQAKLGFLGFSQGAVVATATLLERPERVAWLAAHHGYLPESHTAQTPSGVEGTPVFVGRGSDDQMIPPERGDSMATQLRDIGCRVSGGTYPGGHGIGPDELSDLVEFVETNTPEPQ
jgi:phospholipase/carboxylesterase